MVYTVAVYNVADLKYLRAMLTNQNCMHKEIKSRLNLGNAGQHLVQNPSSAYILSKNIKIEICRTISLPVVYWCGTWSHTLRKERSLRMSENRVLRNVFEPQREEVTGECRKPKKMRSFMIG
jgi:hypothetical protein